MPGSAVAERRAPQGGSRSTFLRQLYPHRPGRWPSRQKHVTSPGRNDPNRTLGDGGLSVRSPSRSPGPRRGLPRAGSRVLPRRALRGRSVICQAPHRGVRFGPAPGLGPSSARARPAPARASCPAVPAPRPRRCVCARTPSESPDACARRADSSASRVLAGRLAACCYTDARKNRPPSRNAVTGDMRTRGAAPCCWQ